MRTMQTKGMQTLEQQYATSKALQGYLGSLHPERARRENMNDLRAKALKSAYSDSLETDPIPLFSYEIENQGWMVDALMNAIEKGLTMDGPFPSWVTKDVLGSAGGTQSPLIRTDLVPHVFDIFVKAFPFIDKVNRIQANGLSHTWNLRTAVSTTTATFVDDFTAATTGSATYNQLSTLIAIGLAERGATFRMKWAQQFSGMQYDGKGAIELEIEAGTVALAQLEQTAAFQGEISTGSKTGTDDFGTYYQYGYDGWRAITGLPTYNSSKYYPNSGTNISVAVGANTYQKTFHTVAQKIADIGGNLDNYDLWMDYYAHTQIASEQGNLVRQDQAGANGTQYGVNVERMLMGGVAAPCYKVPGTSFGSYTPAAGTYGGTAGVHDVYALDRTQVAYACLGPLQPFVIEIPPGVDGTLTNRYIIAWLASMIPYAPALQAKVQLT